MRRNPDPTKNFLWTAHTSRTDSFGLVDESWKLLRNRGYELRHWGKQKNYHLYKGPVFIGYVRFTFTDKPSDPQYKPFHFPNWIFFQGMGKNLTTKTKFALYDVCFEWKDSLVYWDYFDRE